MRRPSSVFLGPPLVIACAAAQPPPPAITPAASASPAATAAPAATSAPEQPSPPVAPAAPVATRQVRQARFALAVPEAAREISPGRWDFGAESGGAPFGVGVSAAPFRGTADQYIRHEFGAVALTDLIVANVADQPGAPGWRAWDVTVPGAESTVMLHARYLTQGARTAFAICVHAEQRGAQEAICRGILGTLRAGREAARNASAPGVATVAENEVAVDLPSSWRRLSGETTQYQPTSSSPEAEREMVVFLGANERTNDLNEVMDGSIAGSRAQARTTVDVRERRTRRVGRESEGILGLRSTSRLLSQRVLGRAVARGGWAWAVVCITPEGQSTAPCEQSVASFEALP